MELKVQLKQAAKKGASIQTGTLSFSKVPQTVQELLTMTCKACLDNFKNKKSEDVVLSAEQIEDMASSGKIGFDFVDGNQNVTEEKAISDMLLAFEDGIVALFIDGERFDDLTQQLCLKGDETLTFVKLTMLAGRMW